MYRWYSPHFDAFTKKHLPIPKWLISVASRVLKKQLQAQGTGRHTDNERWQLLTADISALANFLGTTSKYNGTIYIVPQY